jgi:hypothetical protein
MLRLRSDGVLHCSRSVHPLSKSVLVVDRIGVTPLNTKAIVQPRHPSYSIALLILLATKPDYEISETRLIDWRLKIDKIEVS